MIKFTYSPENVTSPALQFSLAHSHAARTVDPDDFIDDVADVMAGANDDEWKEMIAEEIRQMKRRGRREDWLARMEREKLDMVRSTN